MKIAVLTSSRADYGIYLPLLKKLESDPYFDLRIIAFGTHLSSLHDHTVDAIIADGFKIAHTVEHVKSDDSPKAISASMAKVSLEFSLIWEKEQDNYELVFCLGDRYEMFAAAAASVPFNITLAHVHGGETTLGAIDNKFRHCLSIFSTLHFVSTGEYAKRVSQLLGSESDIYNVGALSLDNLGEIDLLSREEFLAKFKIDLDKPTILVTFHPETVNVKCNEQHARELVKALAEFPSHQVVMTMPNADTMSSSMRGVYNEFAKLNSNVYLVENFGTVAYFSIMNLCKLIVGNSSSGIIEAASFKKYVVDIGDRQLGRITSDNVIHSNADFSSIVAACNKVLSAGAYTGKNIYYKGGASNAIIDVLKKWKA